MEQHPIPQQISSYQFKLVGDMTLKQFFQVAGGVVVSLIFYSTPLHPLIKWPFILLSAGLGAAMAFLPFQERPLEKWIVAFFRSIYSPTIYTWQKTDKPPVFYTEAAPAPAITAIANTGPVVETNSKKLEDAEKSFLQKIGSLWSSSSSASQVNNPQQAVVPTPNTSAPVSTTNVVPINFNASSSTPSSENTVVPTTIPTPQPSPSLDVPKQIPTVITKSAPKLVIEESGANVVAQAPQVTEIEAQKIEEKEITSNTAEFSIDAAPPSPPIAPNTIVGQVMDQDRKIVEGAILEIKDSNGRPVRALKSNRAGHFIIVTSLQNGKYEVTIEKEGFKFEPVSFEAKGEMIPAIAIKGTKL
jgi:hypothetical protein